jgi:hypothetical protein
MIAASNHRGSNGSTKAGRRRARTSLRFIRLALSVDAALNVAGKTATLLDKKNLSCATHHLQLLITPIDL